jgi:hypothetical protein
MHQRIEFLNTYQLHDMPLTPHKRLHNDKNAGMPDHALNTPRDLFPPIQPQQPTLLTPTTV